MEKVGKSVCAVQPMSAEGNKRERKFEIGGATYFVTTHYKPAGGMTAIDKVARLIEKDIETA